ncbi:LysR substrate-binding domain-containing protein [Rhodovibrionaceae bacterium A322]
MNYIQLRAFHAVALEGSFTRAAEALHLTQPTLSGQVKELEETYGIKLFERRGRGIELTELGRALFDVSRRHFALISEAEELLVSARGLVRGTIRIFADAPYLLMPALAAFKRRYPGIRPEITFGNSKQVTSALFDRRCDVGILPEIDRDSRLYVQPFVTGHLVAFVDRGHPWSRRRSIKLEELGTEQLVLREKGSSTRVILERALGQQGITLRDPMEIGSREAVREAVAAGLGIGVVAESEFIQDERLHLLQLKGHGLKHSTSVACLLERRNVRVVSAFLDVLNQHVDP